MIKKQDIPNVNELANLSITLVFIAPFFLNFHQIRLPTLLAVLAPTVLYSFILPFIHGTREEAMKSFFKRAWFILLVFAAINLLWFSSLLIKIILFIGYLFNGSTAYKNIMSLSSIDYLFLLSLKFIAFYVWCLISCYCVSFLSFKDDFRLSPDTSIESKKLKIRKLALSASILLPVLSVFILVLSGFIFKTQAISFNQLKDSNIVFYSCCFSSFLWMIFLFVNANSLIQSRPDITFFLKNAIKFCSASLAVLVVFAISFFPEKIEFLVPTSVLILIMALWPIIICCFLLLKNSKKKVHNSYFL